MLTWFTVKSKHWNQNSILYILLITVGYYCNFYKLKHIDEFYFSYNLTMSIINFDEAK